MRILMTTDTVGGVWTYAVELCRGLGERGLEVVLATMGAPLKPDQKLAVEALRNVRVEESAHALEWMPNPWTEVDAAGEWLLSLEERYSPALTHLNSYSFGTLPWRNPVLVVGHSCVCSWFRAVKGIAAPPEWETYRRRVGEGIRAADFVAAPSAWMLKQLGDHYGPIKRWGVIPNARDVPEERSEGKERFVLSVGRLWDEAKNIAVLARAAHELPWPVLVAGDATGPDGSTRHFPNVSTLGYKTPAEVLQLCRRAAIFAAPVKYEPFGLAILEAALCGCALVLGDTPSLREVWQDAALYVPPDDARRLSATVRQLTESPLLRSKLARKARERGRQFSVKNMTELYLQTYRRVSSAGRLHPENLLT